MDVGSHTIHTESRNRAHSSRCYELLASAGIDLDAYATGLAVDGSGDVWVANHTGANQIVEFIGIATPVITPIVADLPSTPTTDSSSNLGTPPLNTRPRPPVELAQAGQKRPQNVSDKGFLPLL